MQQDAGLNSRSWEAGLKNYWNLRRANAIRFGRRSSQIFDDTSKLRLVFVVSLLLWISIVAAQGVLVTLQSVANSIAGEPQRSMATPQTIWVAFLIYVSCFAAAIITRRLRPSLTVPVTFLIGGLVILVGAVGSSSVGSLLVVIIMVVLAWLVGNMVLRRFPATKDAPIARLPISIALGLGLLGLLLLLFAILEVLNVTAVLVGIVLTLAVLLVFDRKGLAHDATSLREWRPPTPSWFETVVIGMTVGLVAYAALAAFAPENMYDPFRQHLPIAREIWQTGSVSEFSSGMVVSKDPIQGHLLYAVAYGFGGMTAAKLVHTMVGLVAVIGIAGIAWLGAGRVAAVTSAAMFSTLAVVLWELGHAYTDLFPVLYSVAAVLCILLWQRDGRVHWLICSGAIAGFGLAAKMTMGWVAIAIAAALFLVGRSPWRWRDRLYAVVAFGLGTIVVVPWLIRTISITGLLSPKLALMIGFVADILPGVPVLVAAPVDSGFTAPDLQGLALGHSPLDLVRVPWIMTFHSAEHPNSMIGWGDIGIALLMTAPLVVFAPRNRAMAYLGVTWLLSYLAWWLTPLQSSRHFLPTLAIVAALAGIGIASVIAATWTQIRRILAVAAQIGMLSGLAVAPLFFLLGSFSHVGGSSQAPVGLISGRDTADEFVLREIPAAAVLTLTSEILRAETPVAYIGKWGGAQLYTEADLVNMGQLTQESLDEQHGTSPEEVLASLDRLGISYIIWDRAQTKPEDWRSTLLSTEFLRDHGRIHAGDPSGYLIEIVPSPDQSWGAEARRNLLEDPDFDRVNRKHSPWTTVGDVKGRKGRVWTRVESSIAQRVEVSAGSPYLLITSATCRYRGQDAELTLRWFDDNERSLGTTTEMVIPGIEGSEQFLWHRAPVQASFVSVELSSRGCLFDDVALYELS